MKRFRSRSVFAGAIGCASVACFGLAFNTQVELAFACVLYLLLIIVVAWQARLRTAVVTALWSTLCLDFFFTAPKYRLRMLSPTDIWAVAAFGIVAIFVSHLSSRIRRQGDDLKEQHGRQRALYEFSTATLSLDWAEGFEEHLVSLVLDTIRAKGVVLWTERDEQWITAGHTTATADSIEAAFRAGRNYDLNRAGTHIRILKSGTRAIGVLWIETDAWNPLMADSITSSISSALERARALRNEVTARSEQLSEQLRATILDGLAHAFKTPLTTIALSSAGLAEVPHMPPEQRANLLALIRKEADRLNEITQQVLRTARLERNKVLSLQETDIECLIKDIVQSLGSEAQMRILVRSDRSCIVDADPAVLQVAFEQVLENALKYSDAGSEISVTIGHGPGLLSIAIHNTGSYIQPEEQKRIFTRFYRSPDMSYRATGTGVGLAVAHHAIEAHSGRIVVESDPHAGTTFRIDLPKKGETP